MLEAVEKSKDKEEGELDLPPSFIVGLRGCLEAGLSCEEITALLVLFSGVYEASVHTNGEVLVERAVHLANIMSGDIEEVNEKKLTAKKNREARLKRKRW